MKRGWGLVQSCGGHFAPGACVGDRGASGKKIGVQKGVKARLRA